MQTICCWRESPRCICAFLICRITLRATRWRPKTASSNLPAAGLSQKAGIGIRRCIRAPGRRLIPVGSRRPTADRVRIHRVLALPRTMARRSSRVLRQIRPTIVKLPPDDDDIDELHDLVEWIANAKPGDEAAIRAEIKKRFYESATPPEATRSIVRSAIRS